MPAAERRVALLAVGALALAPLALRCRPPHQLLPRALARRRAGAVAPARALAVVHGVAGRLPWRSRCLVKAVAAAWVLSRLGERSLVSLAVRPVPGGIEAHAWAVAGGVAIDGPVTDDWQVVARWPVPFAATT